MPRFAATGRITGLDTARGIAILGMIATHLYPLLQQDPGTGQVSPTWVGVSLTGASSALFVVLAGVGLSLLTRNTTVVVAARVQLTIRALVLIFIGLLLGHAGSNVAIILVHYGVMFLIAMWFIALSRKALTITAVVWLVVAPWFHGMFTRFMQVQAGGTEPYVDQWRLWTSPTLVDVLTRPLVTVWDIVFTGYYPIITFLGYVLVGMAIGRANLSKRSTAVWLALGGAAAYVVCRAVAGWLLTKDNFAYRVGFATGTPLENLSAHAATGAQINTDLLMGAPAWYGLAVPHSGAPLDIYSTTGAALAAMGVCLLLTRSKWLAKLLSPVTATGMIALTAYTAHVILTGLWPRDWAAVVALGDPAWATIWFMLAVHWAMVIIIGVIVRFRGTRGPLEAMLRQVSRVKTLAK